MSINRYKILVLSDLKNSSDTILKTTANLAKMVGGDIDLLHVRKPVDVVKNDNQLSSMRTINRDYLASKNHIESIIKSIDKAVNINYSLIYGNVKQEIEEQIQYTNPDIIVLGKKRFNALRLAGDRVTKFVLNKYKGVVLIASNDKILVPNENLSVGVLNGLEHANESLAKRLMDYTQKPIMSFKIQKPNESVKESNGNTSSNDTVEYIFESSSNSINTLSNYVVKNDIDLLCINREIESSRKGKLSSSNLSKMIRKLDVSMLLVD
ncbi:universal stress protein [Seonamhaeicola sp. MEBiC1930]|uniref:universal stress protein n=1 Tax=Seonamhaeicola sp. MEBiC01930 TaxID=2976768 RepID=UPI00324DDD62